jgi:hypothetical protein
MVAVQVATLDGQGSMLSGATVEEFKQRLRGELLRSADAGYDRARTIWNALIDNWPALIVRCAGAADVIWARELFAAWEPHLPRAVYVNDLGDEGGDRARSAYGANYARLVALKTKYDPTNVFRLNQNIIPTG